MKGNWLIIKSMDGSPDTTAFIPENSMPSLSEENMMRMRVDLISNYYIHERFSDTSKDQIKRIYDILASGDHEMKVMGYRIVKEMYEKEKLQMII